MVNRDSTFIHFWKFFPTTPLIEPPRLFDFGHFFLPTRYQNSMLIRDFRVMEKSRMRIHKQYGFIVVSVMFYLLLHIGTYTGLLVDFILIIRKFSFLNAFRQAPFKFPPKTNEYSFSHLGLTFRLLILQVVNLYFSREKKRSNFLNQLCIKYIRKGIFVFSKTTCRHPNAIRFCWIFV